MNHRTKISTNFPISCLSQNHENGKSWIQIKSPLRFWQIVKKPTNQKLHFLMTFKARTNRAVRIDDTKEKKLAKVFDLSSEEKNLRGNKILKKNNVFSDITASFNFLHSFISSYLFFGHRVSRVVHFFRKKTRMIRRVSLLLLKNFSFAPSASLRHVRVSCF